MKYGKRCHSSLPARTLCYASVVQDTCNASASDINVLKTILYNAKFWILSTSCALGESLVSSYTQQN